MALRAWLPLNGNLENKGASSLSLSATPTFVTGGKIGEKCLNSQVGWFAIPEMAGKKQMSFAYWVKINAETTTNWLDTFSWYTTNGSSAHRGRQEFYYFSNGAGKTGCWYYNNSNSGFDITVGIWTHYTFTIDYETGISKFYINGILKKTTTNIDTNYYLRGTGNSFLLRESTLDSSINDFRLYDHILSEKEVKEISQGLILHYKLNGFSGGSGKNIALKSNNGHFGSTNNLETITFSGWDNYAQYNLNLTAEEWNNLVGQKVTYTCYINNIEQTSGTGTGIMIHFRYEDGTYTQYGGGKNGTSGSYFAQGESGIARLTVTVPDPTIRTNPTTITHVQYSVRHNSSSGAGTVQYQHAQVEIGDTPTAWSYAPEDLGIDITKVVDSSGYGNNGIIVNSLKCITDNNSRYGVCTQFNGSNTYINAGKNAKIKDEITVAWWGYMDTWSSYTRAISCTEGGGWNFEPSGGKLNFAMGTGATSNTYKSCTSNTTLASLSSGWHHFVGTYNGLDSKLYIDGMLDRTLNCYTTKTPIFYNANNNIIIGAEANGSTGVAGSYYNGNLSDVRIYATALSAEDIADLYHTPANIDNLGGIHGFEFQEISNNILAVNAFEQGGIQDANGQNSDGMNNRIRTFYIPVVPENEYRITVASDFHVRTIHYYNNTLTWISAKTVTSTTNIFTTPANCYYVRIAFQRTNANVALSINDINLINPTLTGIINKTELMLNDNYNINIQKNGVIKANNFSTSNKISNDKSGIIEATIFIEK